MMDSGSSLWSTRVWVGRWQSGESDALGELARRFGPLLRLRIRGHSRYQRLQEHLSVEDVEQEVWARVLATEPQAFTPNGSGSFVAWLGAVADHTLGDLLRRRTAHKRGAGAMPRALDTAADRGARPLPGEGLPPSPTQQVRVTEFEQLARQVLLDRELTAWRWVALEGYTSEEAALGLDCTPAAVRSLLVRSRAKLKQALEERGHRDP